MLKTAVLALVLLLLPLSASAAGAEVVDPYGVNPTLGDTSFAKTVPAHGTERSGPQIRSVSGTGEDPGSARWGEVDGGMVVYNAAGTVGNDYHVGLVGLIGLIGLVWGRGRRPTRS